MSDTYINFITLFFVCIACRFNSKTNYQNIKKGTYFEISMNLETILVSTSFTLRLTFSKLSKMNLRTSLRCPNLSTSDQNISSRLKGHSILFLERTTSFLLVVELMVIVWDESVTTLAAALSFIAFDAIPANILFNFTQEFIKYIFIYDYIKYAL